MSDLFQSLFVLGVMALVVVGAFLLCREVLCWYWKINEMLTLLRRIADHRDDGRCRCSLGESAECERRDEVRSKFVNEE